MKTNHQNRKSVRLPRPEKANWVLTVNDGELVTNHLLDLSPTGFSFKAPRKTSFKKGQKLTINLKLESETPDIQCDGHVVWLKNADETTHGTSHHLGVHFENLPAHADQVIMKRINKGFLEDRRREVAHGLREPMSFRQQTRKQNMINPILGIITASVILAALATASFFYERAHQDDNLASRIQKSSFWKKNK